MQKILLDCNAFDYLRDHTDTLLQAKEKYHFCVSTNVIEELCEVIEGIIKRVREDEEKSVIIERAEQKQETLKRNIFLLAKLEVTLLPTSGVIGRFRIGHSYIGGDDDDTCERIKSRLGMDDAIIAKTAVDKDCWIVTKDKDFIKAMNEENLGKYIVSVDDFLKLCSSDTTT